MKCGNDERINSRVNELRENEIINSRLIKCGNDKE